MGETHPRSGLHSRVWRPLPLPSWVTEARKVSGQPPHVVSSHKVTAHMLGAGCGNSTHQTREPVSRRDRRGQCRLDGMLRAERGGCHTLCLSVHWGREVFCLCLLVVGWEGAVPHLVVSGPSLGWRSHSGLFRRPAGRGCLGRLILWRQGQRDTLVLSRSLNPFCVGWARSLVVPSASWTPNGWSRFKGGPVGQGLRADKAEMPERPLQAARSFAPTTLLRAGMRSQVLKAMRSQVLKAGVAHSTSSRRASSVPPGSGFGAACWDRASGIGLPPGGSDGAAGCARAWGSGVVSISLASLLTSEDPAGSSAGEVGERTSCWPGGWLGAVSSSGSGGLARLFIAVVFRLKRPTMRGGRSGCRHHVLTRGRTVVRVPRLVLWRSRSGCRLLRWRFLVRDGVVAVALFCWVYSLERTSV